MLGLPQQNNKFQLQKPCLLGPRCQNSFARG